MGHVVWGHGCGWGWSPVRHASKNNNDGSHKEWAVGRRRNGRIGWIGRLGGAHMHPLDCQLRPHHISSRADPSPALKNLKILILFNNFKDDIIGLCKKS